MPTIPQSVRKIMRQYQTTEAEARRIIREQQAAATKAKQLNQQGQTSRKIQGAKTTGQIGVAKMVIKDLSDMLNEIKRDLPKYEKVAGSNTSVTPRAVSVAPPVQASGKKRTRTTLHGTFPNEDKAIAQKRAQQAKYPNKTFVISKKNGKFVLIGKETA